MPPIIIVSGLPRSGTSMMMKMLAAGGMEIFTDHRRAPDADNPKGYFECDRVKDLAADASWLEAARGRAIKIVSHLLPHVPDELACEIIFMRRDPREILASQNTMLARSGRPAPEESEAVTLARFAMHLRKTRRLLAARPHCRVLEVHYPDVLADPGREAARVAAFVAAALDERAMAAVVDPDLYRNRVPA